MSSGNVVRIGDSVSCGDHSADGSANVFANGMPITHQGMKTTTGHGCFPPTVFIGPWTSTVFVNNNTVALKGKTNILPHRCGKSVHGGVATSGADTVSFEE
jgi:uncharacterized Zn-binding protein involved in type VI secretion